MPATPIKHYQSLMEMIEDKPPLSLAFRVLEDGKVKDITYGHFITDINRFPIRKDKKCCGLICNTNYRSIVAFFAHVKAKKQVVMLSQRSSKETLKWQIKAAEIDHLRGSFSISANYERYLTPGPKDEGSGIIFFTGGATGPAKPVLLSEEAILSSVYLASRFVQIPKDEVILCDLPISHIFGLVDGVLWGLSFGTPICLGGGPDHLLEDVSIFHPTMMPLPPYMATALFGKRAFNPELKFLAIGSEACDPLVISSIQQLGINVSFGYGLTEFSSGVAISLGQDPYKMHVDELVDIKISQEDEILIKSDMVRMDGYYNSPELTKISFTEDGYFHTRDLGSIDEEGYLHVLGRMDDYILLPNGRKVHSSDYEIPLSSSMISIPFFVSKDKKGKLVLVVETMAPQLRIEKAVERINEKLPKEERISRIKYFGYPLPRNQTGRIMRWAVNVEEEE